MPENLTKEFVSKLKYDGKPRIIRDAKDKGFIVAVNKRSISFKVQRDLWRNKKLVKTVRHTIGNTKQINVTEARKRAKKIIADIENGIDPNAPSPIEAIAASNWTVGQMYEEYCKDLRKRECADRTPADIQYRLNRYLAEWIDTPLIAITRTMARTEHDRITEDHGPRAANQTFKEFRAAFHFALRVVDNPDDLPPDPVGAITFNKERGSNRVILPDELPEWWKKIQALQNPLRRDMHTLGILSGLRPGNLVSLERDWVRLEDKAISIPAEHMKARRPFDLPLSTKMVEIVERIIATGDVLYPGTPWLFPARSSKTGEVIATQVWKEKTLPSQTGHILRHTYKAISQRIEMNAVNSMHLLAHKVPGISGVYLHERALFDRLLEEQEKMTTAIFCLLEQTSS